MADDLLLVKAREFTNFEDQTLDAWLLAENNRLDDLARRILDAGLMLEHYTSLSPEDVSRRTPQPRKSVMLELATAGSLTKETKLRTARVGVVGLRYLRLPLAEAFAGDGFPVLGLVTDPEKVRKLRTRQGYPGRPPPSIGAGGNG
jgi:hypothetical protein